MPHKIDLLLSCAHIQHEAIEAAIFVPLKGEQRICNQCKKNVVIARVGTPYWSDEDQEEKSTNKKA